MNLNKTLWTFILLGGLMACKQTETQTEMPDLRPYCGTYKCYTYSQYYDTLEPDTTFLRIGISKKNPLRLSVEDKRTDTTGPTYLSYTVPYIAPLWFSERKDPNGCSQCETYYSLRFVPPDSLYAFWSSWYANIGPSIWFSGRRVR